MKRFIVWIGSLKIRENQLSYLDSLEKLNGVNEELSSASN